mgnify:CR=1 FL=1
MSNPDRNHLLRTDAVLRRAGRLAIASGMLVMAVASAQQLPMKYIEECLESGTELVALPAQAAGPVSASECRGCETRRLQFDRSTRYFIGKEQVSYAKLREAAAKGDVRLDLFYEPKTRKLTRLRLAAAGNAK